MTSFPPHVTLYNYCSKNSIVKEAKQQSHPYYVLIYVPDENNVIN